MNHPFRPENSVKRRILVVPLDWGLGHATRCIPLIRLLLEQGCEVWMAGEAAQEKLLRTEFPEVPFLELAGYRVRYAKTAFGLAWGMIRQLAKIKRAIRDEHEWLKKMVAKYQFDTIISDNRYGLYHTHTRNIFMTHQLRIKSPFGKWMERLLQKRNYSYINKFTVCWVPDYESADNMAGSLSRPASKPNIPVRYVGALSRFERKDIPEKKGQLLIVLSGPEPQRSILEEKIINEIVQYPAAAIIVRGLPGETSMIPSTNMIRFYNHLPAFELNQVMQESEYVISRSGYSTVMDILTLKKKSIMIPTPGQTEQEHVGKHLMKNNMTLVISQRDFSIQSALLQAGNFDYHLPDVDQNGLLMDAVRDELRILSR